MPENKVKDILEKADEFLKQENTAWVNKSSLHLRAFYLGLYVCAKEFGSDENDLQQIGSRIISDTMFQGSADDHFLTTEIGKAFDSLEDELRSLVDEYRHRNQRDEKVKFSDIRDDPKELFSDLRDRINRLEAKTHRNLHEIREILREMDRLPEQDEPDNLFRLLKEIEDRLRNLSDDR